MFDTSEITLGELNDVLAQSLREEGISEEVIETTQAVVADTFEPVLTTLTQQIIDHVQAQQVGVQAQQVGVQAQQVGVQAQQVGVQAQQVGNGLIQSGDVLMIDEWEVKNIVRQEFMRVLNTMGTY